MAGSDTSTEPVRNVDLAQIGIPRVFFALLHQRFTGTVQLAQPAPHVGLRTIWIRGGLPVFTDWHSSSEVLGEILLAKGKIDSPTLDAALLSMVDNKQRLGETLCQAGKIDDTTLREALKIQCMRKLSHCFAIENGTAILTATEHNVGQPIDGKSQDGFTPINALRLIGRAISVHFDETRIRSQVGSILDGPMQASAAFARYRSHFGFRPEDEPWLDQLVLGVSNLSTAANPTNIDTKRKLQLIYILWNCEMIRTGSSVIIQTPSSKNKASPSQPEQNQQNATAPTKRSENRKQQPSSSADHGSKAKRSPAESNDSAAFLQELETFESQLEERAHAFALFGLNSDANRKQIRGVWAELSKRFHPDSLESRGLVHLRDRVEQVFSGLSEAYSILSDAKQRTQLKDVIEAGGSGQSDSIQQEATTIVRNAFESDLVSREADKLLKNHHYARALELYLKAEELSPGEGEVQASRIWCEYQVQERSSEAAERARKLLISVSRDQPNCAKAHYYLGMVCVRLNATNQAASSFQEAIRIDRRLVDAERQLRALQISIKNKAANHSPTSEKKTGLRGLFGRKG